MFDYLFNTRREFLTRGLTLIGGSATIPAFLQNTAYALAGPDDAPAPPRGKASQERVLVVVQLAGGNDGLNTVIPRGNDDYHRARPRLAIARDKSLKLTDDLGLHPAAEGLKELYDNGMLSIIQAVGYPNPDRSHFKSTDIWMTADPDERTHTGWLGRYCDCTCRGSDPPDPKTAIALTAESPLALSGPRFRPVAFSSPDQLSWRPGPDQDSAEDAFAKLNQPSRAKAKPTTMLDYVQRTALDARLSAEQIQRAAGESPSRRRGRGAQEILARGRPDLSQQLRMVARMIAARLPTRVYYVSMSGFDTHANQLASHENLMRQLGRALLSFTQELKTNGDLSRVLVMTFSEFGRRVGENASGGTDHGAAAPMFLIGPSIHAGIHGKHASLTDLDRGDLKWSIDFRGVYAAVLSKWLKADAKKILGGDFSGPNVLR